jgi:hypothetical protein
MGRPTLIAAMTLVAAAVACGTARADGLPVVGVDSGPEGVAEPDGEVRYVALPAGRDTLAVSIEQDGGRVLASRLLRGRLAVPLVAFDGSAGGLSADGGTLVLIRPRAQFPRQQTGFSVLDAGRLRVRDAFALRGDFSFDALSPDGRWLYLIEYLSPTDPNRYAVRLYDLAAGRLEPEPIVDPEEAAEPMRGYPITRATSPGGRWAYTLYDGAGEHPFVHALDTVGRAAVCIDLDLLAGRDDLYELRLAVSGDGATLEVRDGDAALAVVDTGSFAVGEASAAPALEPPVAQAPPAEPVTAVAPAEPMAAVPGRAAGPGRSVPWALVGAASGALLALGAVGAATFRRRKALARPLQG